MTGFSKLFSSIVTSSIWCEDDTTLRVWIAMLATANADGIVEGSVPGFANLARVSVEQMEAALEKLSSPDDYSRTPDNDGRRIEPFDGGWLILNYGKYRATQDPGFRKKQVRDAVEKHRAAKKAECNQNVITSNHEKTQAEAEAEAEAEKEKSAPAFTPDFSASKADLLAQELVSEINRWIPAQKLAATHGFQVQVANLLMCGHADGVTKMRGSGPEHVVGAGELMDAAHGFIVAENWDKWHACQRDLGSPVSFVRLLRNPARIAEYAERGRKSWDEWWQENNETTCQTMAACERDHDKTKVRMGPNWACPDRCGWYRRVDAEVTT